MSFVEVTSVSDIPEGQMKSFTVGDSEILVVNYQGKFFAIRGKCTHMGGDLSKGKLDGKLVTCPRHKSVFDVTTGECISGPKMPLIKPKIKDETVYEVKVEGNSIKVNI
jgi:nitrite reductase/ring-hydroxylating ferredoxin subunit